MQSKEEVVEYLYKAFGSSGGILFGIENRKVVEVIVEITLNRIDYQSPQSKDVEANEAIEFAEWLRNESWQPCPKEFTKWHRKLIGDGLQKKSTAELYKLFEGGKLSDNDKQKQ